MEFDEGKLYRCWTKPIGVIAKPKLYHSSTE